VQAVKEAVRIEQVASDYGDFRLSGPGRLVGQCVCPDHDDRTPSLFIFLKEQRFKCFGIGCGASGDVLDLMMLASPDMALWEALVDLSVRYGVDLPGRPDSWYRKQARQRPIRNAIDEAKVLHIQRRVFRIFVPLLREIEVEREQREETEALWDLAEEIATLIWAGRSS
jgi:DNA primase